jgi:hypothetical protein
MISILEKLGSYQYTTSSFFCAKFHNFAKFWTFSVVKFNVFVEDFATFRKKVQEITRFLYMLQLVRPKIYKDV